MLVAIENERRCGADGRRRERWGRCPA